MERLETARLILRDFKQTDAADVYAYARDPRVGPNAGWPPHQSLAESQAIVAGFMAAHEVWAIEKKETGRVIGSIGLHDRRGERELGYALGADEWGQGLMTEAAGAVLAYAFEVLALPRVRVCHFPFNQRSRRVIEKLGFRYVETLPKAAELPDGTLADDICYTLSQEDYDRQKEGKKMIALGCDHTALEMKKEIMALLDEMGLEYRDFGTYDSQSCDYPVYGFKAAQAVARGECDKGILICGTGVGIGLAANKVKGIRCVTCSEPYSAIMARQHNNANMISFGARVVGAELAKMIVKAFLTTAFEGGRHARRVALLSRIENGEAIG